MTGGFGKHFNESQWPHANLVVQRLLQAGVKAADLLAALFTANTVEDAFWVGRFAVSVGVSELVVVTSDFHVERCKTLFELCERPENVRFVGAPHGLDEREHRDACEHERRALEEIRAHGVTLPWS